MGETKIIKSLFSIYFILLIIMINFFGLLIIENDNSVFKVEAKTIIVDKQGGGDYFRIQDAINASKPGDTIYVWAGTYYENIVIRKSVTLIGNGTINTTINSNRKGDVVYVSAEYVNISRFTITNSGYDQWEDSGIELNGASNCTLSNINCSFNNFYGIYIYRSKDNSISNCTCIKNCWWAGIFLYYSHNNKIHNNSCSNHENGIVLEFSGNNIISNNICKNNQAGISFGNRSNIVINNNCSNNNYILGGSFSYSGISFAGFYHTIKNNSCYSNEKCGIKSGYSNSCIIDNNVCINNGNGIELNKPSKIIISNNTLYSDTINIKIEYGISITVENNLCVSDKYAISIIRSEDCFLINNSMIENGIIIEGYSIEHWITHSIDTSNKVNNESVYFYKHRNGNIFPVNPGQIILANCDNCTIENYNFDNTSIGIELGFSNNIIIQNNTCFNSTYGIYLSYSNYNSVNNNIFFDLTYGICLLQSDYNILKNNYISNISSGIYLDSNSDGNNITRNKCNRSYNNGIALRWQCEKNVIKNNHCSLNHVGLYLGTYAKNNLITNCTFVSNDNGIELSDSSSNMIRKNLIKSNNRVGIYFKRFSSNNEIVFNDFINNSYFAIIIGSESYANRLNNRIHHNNFINNNHGYNQAEDISTGNLWNTSTEGNYWSDWIIPDNNFDGIIDKPYDITGKANEKDHYPLKTPLNSLKDNDDKDIDNDIIPDDWEKKYDFNFSNPNDSKKDTDEDNLTNYEEYLNNTNPREPDSDNDGLTDGDEIKIYYTNPLNPDSDGDTFFDGIEIENSTDPLDKNDYSRKDKIEKGKESEMENYALFIIAGITIIIVLFVLVIFILIRYKKRKDISSIKIDPGDDRKPPKEQREGPSREWERNYLKK